MSNSFNTNLISTKLASELCGYHPDYIGRLCRSGKIKAVQFGREWLIDRESLLDFCHKQEHKQKESAERLSRVREKEYREAQRGNWGLDDQVAPKATTPSRTSNAYRENALAVIVTLVVGIASLYSLHTGVIESIASQNLKLVSSAAEGMRLLAMEVPPLPKTEGAYNDRVSEPQEYSFTEAFELPSVTINDTTNHALAMSDNRPAQSENTEEPKLSSSDAIGDFVALMSRPRISFAAFIANAYVYLGEKARSSILAAANVTLATEVAFGSAVTSTSHSILALHEKGINSFIAFAPKLSSSTVGTVYGIGNYLGVGTTFLPRTIANEYDQGITAWVNGSYEFARLTDKTFFAVGEGIFALGENVRTAHIAVINGTGELAYNKVSGILEETEEVGPALAVVPPGEAKAESAPETQAASGSLAASAAEGAFGLETLALYTYQSINNLFYDVLSSIAYLFRPSVAIILPAPTDIPSPAGTSSSYSIISQTPVQNIVNQITIQGVTYDVLNQKLAELRQQVSNDIYNSLDENDNNNGGGGGGGGSGSVTSVDVSGGSTGFTFAGGPITSSGILTMSGVLAIANGGTGTATAPTYGDLLVGDGVGGYTLMATSSLGIGAGSGSPGGANTQVQFNNAGLFAGDAGFTYNLTDDRVTVVNASTTAFSSNTLAVGQTATTTISAAGTLTTPTLGINSETFTDLTGAGLQNSGGVLTLNATGDWTGTFDGQEGSFYLARANHTGTQLSTTISDFVEAAGDAVGGILTDTSRLDFTYNDGGNTISADIVADSIGDSQLAFNTGQNLTTASAVTFATVDTGQGANELYDMDQNVLTTSAPTFGGLTLSNATGGGNQCLHVNNSGVVTVTGSDCGSGGGGGISLIGPLGQTADGPTVTFATSSVAFNGLTASTTITGSGDTLTFTNTFAGTLGNAGLTNSTVSYGGVTLSLGGTDATPAFDLTDATNLPITAGTTGTLGVARGGTGQTSFTSSQLLYGNGTNALSSVATTTLSGNSQIALSQPISVLGPAGSTLSIVADSIGDTQLAFDTGQNLTTASAVTFATVDTGQGANELFDMDQNVLTTSDVAFNTATLTNTGLHLLDTNASHDLIIAPGSNITADRTLTITTGDADRTLTLNGNATLNDWFDQSVKTSASPTFGGLTLSNATGGGDQCLHVNNSGVVTVTGSDCGSSGGGGVSLIGPTGQTVDGPTVTIASTTSSFNGLTVGNTIVGGSDTLTWTPTLIGTLNNAGLTNSSVSYGGVTLSLGGSDATPAFDLTDATNLPITAGTTGTLGVARGGTGQASFTSGELLYGNGTNALSSVATTTLSGNSQIALSQPISVLGPAGSTLSIVADSIGDTQLAFNTGQNLTTASAVTFATVDTGQGANELYDMDQNVQTTDSVTFANINLSNGGALRTTTTAADTLLLQARDVDGASYTTFGTLTANNTPTFDLSDAVTKAGNYIYRAGGTDVAVADGGTGASTLNDLITLGTHTTGDYVATITGSGTITSSGATTGEGIAHTLSVTADSIGDTQLAFNTGQNLTMVSSPTFAGLTLSSPLSVANGGTGAATFTNNRVLTGNGTSALVDEANLTFDGSLLTVTGNASTTQLTTTGSAYLATTGGNVGIGLTAPAYKLQVRPLTDVNFQFRAINGGGFFTLADDADAVNVPLEIRSLRTNFTGGNVGIDEASPGSKLAVSGNATVGVNYDTTAAPTNGLLVEGSVGIGTTSPYALLSIFDTPANVSTTAFAIGSSTAAFATTTLFSVSNTGAVSAGSLALTTALPITSGGTGATSLNNLITLSTHTTGDYVATITGSATITSSGATTGEGIAHTLSVTADSIGDTQLAFNTGQNLTTASSPTFAGLTLSSPLTVANGGSGAATFTGGILVGNGTSAFITRTLTGNSQITVTNGTGVSGNPTLSITADSIGDTQLAFDTGQALTTASSPTFANVTLSNGGALRTTTTAGETLLLQARDVDGASYTTFGTLTANNTPTFDLSDAVTKGGGNYIYRAGGTDVAVADGGTGASTLNDLITLATHTTGNYVATITGSGTITSSGATIGENIAHTLSVTADSIGDTQLAFNTGQNLTTASSPTFAGITNSALTSGRVVLAGTSGVLQDSANLTFSGSTLVVGGGTGKVTLGTFDPVYTVGGIAYATYAAGMIGIKEEVTGTTEITTPTTATDGTQGYIKEIDFENEPTGSNLWLFAQATHLKKNIGELAVLLSSEGSNKVWYSVDKANQKVYLLSDTPTKVSYRFTAPRFDSDEWSNLNHDGVVGFLPPSNNSGEYFSDTGFISFSSTFTVGTTTLEELTTIPDEGEENPAAWAGALAGISDGLKDAMDSLTDVTMNAFEGAQYYADGVFKRVFAGEVHTDKICVSDEGGETCLTRAELNALLAGAAASGEGSGGSGGSSGGGEDTSPPEDPTPPGEDGGTPPADDGGEVGAGDDGSGGTDSDGGDSEGGGDTGGNSGDTGGETGGGGDAGGGESGG